MKNKTKDLYTLRDVPNLHALRNSKKPKYNKIGDKIYSCIQDNQEVTPFTDEEIHNKCNKLGLRCAISINGNLSIKSRCDSWMLINNTHYWTLYHGDIKYNKTAGKAQNNYHLQDVFSDLDFALASIVTHDAYALNFNNFPTMNDIRELTQSIS